MKIFRICFDSDVDLLLFLGGKPRTSDAICANRRE